MSLLLPKAHAPSLSPLPSAAIVFHSPAPPFLSTRNHSETFIFPSIYEEALQKHLGLNISHLDKLHILPPNSSTLENLPLLLSAPQQNFQRRYSYAQYFHFPTSHSLKCHPLPSVKTCQGQQLLSGFQNQGPVASPDFLYSFGRTQSHRGLPHC